jgi:hypothetical protein
MMLSRTQQAFTYTHLEYWWIVKTLREVEISDAELNIGTGPESVRFTPCDLKFYTKDEGRRLLLHGITSRETLIICIHLVITTPVRMCTSLSIALLFKKSWLRV